MADLIARLEAAGEGSRELDGQIGLLVHPEAKLWTPEWWSGGPNEYLRWPDPKPDVAKYEQLPRYTTSLDAALPWEKDGFWEISGPRQYLNIPSPVPNYWCAEFTFGDRPPYKTVKAWAATEALARRIAALKAREKQD